MGIVHCTGRGHAWQGTCMVMGGGVSGRGHAWQERRPLQLTVRVLLECILVYIWNESSTWVTNVKGMWELSILLKWAKVSSFWKDGFHRYFGFLAGSSESAYYVSWGWIINGNGAQSPSFIILISLWPPNNAMKRSTSNDPVFGVTSQRCFA